MFGKFWEEHGYTFLILCIIAFIVIISIIIYKRSSNNTDITADLETCRRVILKKNRPPKVSSGEAECRKVLEEYFNKPFIKCRPDFMKNNVTSTEYESHNLELDCYNDELKIACEYNGRQHYDFIPFFHKSRDSFYNQKYRDELKRIMCINNGILLIEVPYTVPNTRIKDHIISILVKNKL